MAIIFRTQLFTSVVVFGLFHGLVFLPVILSLYGPDEKKKRNLETKENDEKTNGNRDQNGFTTIHLPPICPGETMISILFLILLEPEKKILGLGREHREC